MKEMNYFGTAVSGGNTEHVYDGPVFEGYNVNHDGEHQIALESYQENFAITQLLAQLASTDYQSKGKIDGAVLESAGEAVLESLQEEREQVLEAAGAGVVSRAKEFLKKLWGKVKAFFASIVRSIDLMTKSGQDFVKKYKKQLEGLKTAGMKETTYNYTLDALNIEQAYKANTETADAAINRIVNNLGKNIGMGENDSHDGADSAIDKFREGKEERLEQFRAKLVGGAGKLDASELRDAVRKLLRDGKDEKAEVNVNIQAIISDLEGSSKLTATISKAQREADKFYGDTIKSLDNLEKALNKDGADFKNSKGNSIGKGAKMSSAGSTKAATIASIVSSEVSAKQAVVNTVFSEWNSAVKERDSEYKRILRAAFSYKQKN